MDAKPAVHPDLAVGDALAAFVRDILTEARTAIDDEARSGAEAVHDYRKAMKRWRALLRLIEPFIGEDGPRLRMQARDLARELAGARDAQSALDALGDLGKADEALGKSATATPRKRLMEIRQSAEETTLTETMRGRLRAALTAADLATATWPLGAVSFSALAGELAVGYGRARRAMPADFLRADGHALHELRQRVVEHRYQMELVEPLWPRMGKLWIGEAQRLRDRLGAHHDLDMLTGLTAPHQLLARWRSRLTPAIALRQESHARAAARLAGRLFAERPKAFRRRLEALWANRAGDGE
jgi:CHAD domain-containing protein